MHKWIITIKEPKTTPWILPPGAIQLRLHCIDKDYTQEVMVYEQRTIWEFLCKYDEKLLFDYHIKYWQLNDETYWDINMKQIRVTKGTVIKIKLKDFYP